MSRDQYEAGHGKDPFFLQLSTLQGVLEAAPTMAKAFVFAELERTDSDMEYAVRTHLIPLAELCRKQGTAKIYLRTKNVFWNANCYEDLWRDTLLSGRYRDVFVPSMEETNCRTQEISLSGRTGLWMAGLFDHVSARAVTDNATFSRFWETSPQQIQSHHLRHLALNAALGADIFLVNNYQGDPLGYLPFIDMVEKGAIFIPRRGDLLSVSGLCLGMKSPMLYFLEHGSNGHDMNGFEPGRGPAVFDRLDCYWAGSPAAEHDFSRYAMGTERRMLNFLPPNPYGLIASVPAETPIGPDLPFQAMIVTDGEVFYDDSGRPVPAPEYMPIAQRKLLEAAEDMPLLVRGGAAWAAARVDPAHIRVTLIDPGYISPADRAAQIVLQRIKGLGCRDILSGEEIRLKDGVAHLTVPAGALRIVDIEHE
ncbi:MAG: Lambda-carrageenase precursor [candidate division BRC1 bacterium ADurb.BinA364]|nr:MAG: Lambda-carrageenase precursor [candidate division BRC1 bacterium ADurb.BinA364]